MKIKYAVFLYIVGLCLSKFGALLKIIHYPGADETLIISLLIQTLGIFMLIYKLITHPKLKEVLEW